MRWVIAYDVTDDKRRRKVARRLEQVGFRRQKSVFEGEATVDFVESLLAELSQALDHQTDRLTAWPTVESSHVTIRHVGVAREITESDWQIL